jgi:hypothetical protein
MLSLVPRTLHQVSIRELGYGDLHQLLDRRQSVSQPSGLITSPRPGTRKRVCVCMLNNAIKQFTTTMGKAVHDRSGELQVEMPERRYVVTVTRLDI